jgi:hypothetical protein
MASRGGFRGFIPWDVMGSPFPIPSEEPAENLDNLKKLGGSERSDASGSFGRE